MLRLTQLHSGDTSVLVHTVDKDKTSHQCFYTFYKFKYQLYNLQFYICTRGSYFGWKPKLANLETWKPKLATGYVTIKCIKNQLFELKTRWMPSKNVLSYQLDGQLHSEAANTIAMFVGLV